MFSTTSVDYQMHFLSLKVITHKLVVHRPQSVASSFGPLGVVRLYNIFDFVIECLGDPLAKTLLGCLELLEGLSRSLDKEYKYGLCKCWKHAAEYFNIEEEEYQNFKCNLIHSPTEVMFEYLQTCNPEITIGNVKDGLHSIGRQDVINVLIKHEQSEYTIINN